MTEDDLKAIEARTEAATPGPWEQDLGSVKSPHAVRGVLPAYVCGIASDQDATFIAAARTDVPDLVAEVRRLRELGRELAEACEEALRFAQEHDTLPKGGYAYPSEYLKAHDVLAKAREAGL